jgi:hypothetical protein
MILAAAVILGFAAGLARSLIGRRSIQIPPLRHPWLVILAFIPQWISFYFLRTRDGIPDAWAPFILVGTQVLLLVFSWLNRKQSGFWILGLGLFLNILVIVLNGGLMPISPDTVRVLYPLVPESHWQVGERLGNGKDIVLLVEQTRLWFLSDRFLLPGWFRYPMAYSLGDVFIAIGAFWLMWTTGAPPRQQSKQVHTSIGKDLPEAGIIRSSDL